LGSMGVPLKVEVNGKKVFLCCEGCRDRLLADPEKYFAILEEAKKNPDVFNAPAEMELPAIGEMTFVAPDIPPMLTPLDVPHMVDVPLPAGDGIDNEAAAIAQSFSRLSDDDLQLARRQAICPVAELKLGTMGPPIKINVDGRSVFICCEGCREKLLKEPAKYLARLPRETAQ